ncbi:DUF1491 family protein [Prosthecomicrobium hirschii]|uniref:DUF1491 family protein n=1 Tax=Prosthecodimorpha hirschii TaxID=665126 RepID=UPI00222096D5|nr:DUF1491 family protein [Prosthecomicrobium hirschii]MCW1840649.1 DUF1491 family protein [Prosthecomicrobium hirschii]
MIRLKSAIWVAAHIRRLAAEGITAMVARSGSEEAGAIFVKVWRRDGTADLYGPAPQSAFEEDGPGPGPDRLFERLAERVPERDVEARLASERRFDPDCWVIEIEDADGRHRLDLVKPDNPADAFFRKR